MAREYPRASDLVSSMSLSGCRNFHLLSSPAPSMLPTVLHWCCVLHMALLVTAEIHERDIVGGAHVSFPNFLGPHDTRQEDQCFSSMPVSRYLSDPSQCTHGRSLTDETCTDSAVIVMHMMPPPALQNYYSCMALAERDPSIDWGVAGTSVRLHGECWCNNSAKAAVDSFNCCGHEAFSPFCKLRCSPDCSSVNAQACITECPALCLERDHAPNDQTCQRCRDNNCNEWLICIAEHAQTQTMLGLHERICDKKAFHTSPEVLKFHTCQKTYPQRTYWHRINSQEHCMCSEDVQTAAARHSCCNANWARDAICGVPTCSDNSVDKCCRTTTQCDSPEAKACLNVCKDKCVTIGGSYIFKECNEQCFNSSTCMKYVSCKPLHTRAETSYEYICNDGSSPQGNGCCSQQISPGLVRPVCPSLCKRKGRYILDTGEVECQCAGCPATNEQATNVLNLTVVDSVYANGNAIATSIAKEVGLSNHLATPRMQQIVTERNSKVLSAMREIGALPNAKTQAEITRINAVFNELLLAQARRDKALQAQGKEPEPELPPTKATDPSEISGSTPEDEGEFPIGIVIGICVAVVIGICAAGLMYTLTRPKSTPPPALPQQSSGTVTPNDGDLTVVVGRAVAGAPANTQPGAPVQTGGEAPPAKGDAKGGDGAM